MTFDECMHLSPATKCFLELTDLYEPASVNYVENSQNRVNDPRIKMLLEDGNFIDYFLNWRSTTEGYVHWKSYHQDLLYFASRINQ